MLQPLLHDLVGTVMAPTGALSGTDGQLRPAGVQGLFHADRRVLSQARLLVDDTEPEAVGHAHDGAGRTRFVSLARWLGDSGADPTVRLDRVRELTPYGMTESVEISSTASVPVNATVTVELACDFAAMDAVKTGRVTGFPVPAAAAGQGRLTWRSAGAHVIVTGQGAEARPGDEPRLTWKIDLPPRGRTTLSWRLVVQDPAGAFVVPAAGPPEWSPPRVDAADRRLTRLLDQALADLRSLRLATPDAPEDTFLGAGVPWFLTLFGRDSIWAARMLLPLGTALAGGTLRVLARRQGERLDPRSGEAPGKIMHELRRHAIVLGEDGRRVPAAYYGTIDATPLWISLLHDAWRWGLPEHEVEPLLPHLEAALGWLADHADPDRDGFLEYVDTSGHGLANQGWKDSGDSIRFHDGSLAEPPIALAEVQGYAHQAALHGAALLDAFGRPGADRWREYAATLAGRFRAAFWVDGAHGPFPALALDRDKRPVDALTSNIGHLLGTGLLTPEESAQVAGLLGGPGLAEGFGLRTMSALDAGFSPLSYHCGSIWPHDTAIVLAGLAREGFDAQAATLAEGLLAAAESFDYRLPELYGGDARHRVGRPVAYPAACRPQAWSAAAALTIVHAALGLHPDVPAGQATLRPLAGAPLGALTVGGLRVAGGEVEVSVAGDGTATVTGLPDGMRLIPGR
ncbi:glycogen debranching N-terminal domain-containing protein [Nonomuraea jiangxiensis]|uniref:Glycogen debranching enzyme (Alpha-1,6-glucosidase) n=1 Tax=Nonomuraea jiangxiensis TaxID=633440 RepID=A0A1G8T4Y9_9ACTN|nr:glycogen debranching N-terminal domain-containing protein [Nonomuraea jiangxiensis]SDJ36543.1 Glycogen debranching enzyme (alpha-1,6-glucosidase) [Nonomuraea jiangxiensis]